MKLYKFLYFVTHCADKGMVAPWLNGDSLYIFKILWKCVSLCEYCVWPGLKFKTSAIHILYTVCVNFMYTLFETLFLSKEMRQTQFVFYSLNFLKPVHVQIVHLLPQYTLNNDVEQSDIPSALLLMEYHWWHVQYSTNTGFFDINLTRTLPQWPLWE